MTRFAIVIPHFNRAELLTLTLDSVREQTFDDWEVIVVDDGSDSAQRDLLDETTDHRIRILDRVDGPKGPSRCRNIGLNQTTADYVIFLDSDDLLAPWCLEQRHAAINDNLSADLHVFPVMLFHTHMGDSDVPWNDMTPADDLNRFLRSDPPWHTSSPAWKRQALEELGGFNEAVMYGDDADLHIRAILASATYTKHPNSVPDVFVRRDSSPRITDSVSAKTLESRRVRLREGTRAVACATDSQQRVWEGQYFMEAEFLLFNVTAAREPIQEVLTMWRQHYCPASVRSWLVDGYFAVALHTRDRLYLLLRIARRVAMLLLPQAYFATPSSFCDTPVAEEVRKDITARLATNVRKSN